MPKPIRGAENAEIRCRFRPKSPAAFDRNPVPLCSDFCSRSKIGWLGTFRALPNGIPAHDTFRRVFLLIDTGGFERGFAAWARSFGAPVDRDVVAIDGKTIRGFFDRGREQGPLHVVSAWACDRRLVLGQRQIGDKSNEISAIPELLTALDLKGAIVTLDAMGCQRAIATRILKRGADYLVVLKANQGKKFTAVQELCAATCFSRSPPPPAGP